MIEKNEIEKYLTTKKLGRNAGLFKEIERSTNDYLAEKIKLGESDAVIAMVQHGGKGRVGRTWLSGKEGESIALSFFVSPKVDLEKLPQLTLVAALCVKNAIVKSAESGKLAKEKIKIKWPNDILIGEKKICGILTELKQTSDKNFAIIGIGINIRQKSFEGELAGTASSLKLEGIEILSIEKLVAEIFNEFEQRLERFEADGFVSQVEEYNESLTGKNEEASVINSDGKTILEGTIKYANDSGELIICDKDGNEKNISSGELSIRGGFYGRK